MLKTLCKVGVVTGALGGLLVLAAPAQAADNTSGNQSILGGNQIKIPIQIPITVSHNGIGILGTGIGG